MRWFISSKKFRVALVLCFLGAHVNAEYVDPTVLDGCPGYTVTNVEAQRNGLTADLVLAGKPCNIFGDDVQKLTLSVAYETGM